MDFETHRQQMLEHCVSLAKLDKHYAWWAAKRYAAESEGVLHDLPQRLTEAMKQGETECRQQPTARPLTSA